MKELIIIFATQDITLTILKSLPMILANYHSSKK